MEKTKKGVSDVYGSIFEEFRKEQKKVVDIKPSLQIQQEIKSFNSFLEAKKKNNQKDNSQAITIKNTN